MFIGSGLFVGLVNGEGKWLFIFFKLLFSFMLYVVLVW